MAMHPGQESHLLSGTRTQALEQTQRHVATRIAPTAIATLLQFRAAPVSRV
jgi:hypothetical protein